jgi:hypothetical protein
MATAHVKSVRGSSASSSAPTRAFGSNVSAGNLICGWIEWQSAVTLNSVTDSQSNAYTLKNNPTSQGVFGYRAAMFYAENIAGGACTLTFTFSAATTSSQEIHEASGCATSASFDGSALASQDAIGSGANAVTSGNITTTAAGDYIFGASSEYSAGGQFTQGTGFTLTANVSNSLGGFTAGEYIAPAGAAGSIAATFTKGNTGNYLLTGIMAFKASGGGGGGGKPWLYYQQMQQGYGG